MGDKNYLPELMAEKDNLDPSFSHAMRLLNQEIERVQSGGKIGASQKEEQPKYLEVTKDKPIKLTTKILVPVKEHPKFNFVGKLLGPKGNSLKRLQEETGSKMAILGRGSMRDKQKEEELRSGKDPKYAHLNDDLHVHIEVYSTPSDAHSRLAHAIAEVQKFMIPDYNDDIRQDQLRELAYINGVYGEPGALGAGRGRGRGRGAALSPSALIAARGGLLATPGNRSAGISRQSSIPSGRGPLRGPARDLPSTRIAFRGSGSADSRSAEDTYGFDSYDTPYDSYESQYQPSSLDTQYFDYGHGADSAEGYDDGYGNSTWGANSASRLKASPARPKTSFRDHPYGNARPTY